MFQIQENAVESKQPEDGKFQLEDGRNYPMFSHFGIGNDKINCNICDLLMSRSTGDAFKHAASLGHRHRLCDIKLATATLLKCVKYYGLVAPTNDSISLDEDDTPPGCEELLSQSHTAPEISLYLKSHCKSALIGLEYVVEVNPDRNMSCTSHSFYICLLCEKRCDNHRDISEHIQSSAHRVLYLRKYFPRAHSLFLQADPCIETWSREMNDYLRAIASRIEAFKGRLQVLSCHRTQWDVKSQYFRTKIDLGIHHRETPDLLYDDITSPFTATDFGDRADDRRPEFSLGATDDKCKIPFKKGTKTRVVPEAIILLSDDSMSEADSEKRKKSNGLATRQSSNKAGSCRTIGCQKAEEMLLPLDMQAHSVTENNEKSSTEMLVYQSVEDEEVMIVEEGSVQKDVKVSRHRHRQRSRKKLRSKSSSVNRHAVSKSHSRSPKRFHASPSSSRQRQSHHRRNTEPQQSSMGDAGYDYNCERREHRTRRGGSSQTPTKQCGENSKNEVRYSKIVEQELHAFKEILNRKLKIYRKRPEDHPLYAVEWKIFWKKRYSELEKKGKNPYNHNYKSEWFAFWYSRMRRLSQQEIAAKKTELIHKYSLISDETDQSNPPKGNEHASGSNSKNQKWVQFGWKKISNEMKSKSDLKSGLKSEDSKMNNLPSSLPQPTEIPAIVEKTCESSSFEELRILHESNGISNVVGTPSHFVHNGVSNDPSLLQVLRMLVALEDSLGSLGPSITQLLSRALSAERCRVGSSSQLLEENVTFVVDLLDTSKEKLKGLVCAGILDGVKATAASQAVESVTRFLELSARSVHCGQTSDVLTSDIASLIRNLQAAGLLRPLQSATAIPCVSSSVQSSSIGKMEEMPSNYSSQFHSKDRVTDRKNEKSQFDAFDQFTGEELKTLIVNFRTLTASQKHDLINCLRHVEERYVAKSSLYQSQSVSSSSSSPLPEKCHQFEDDSDISIIDHDPRPSQIRYPSILKMTGLSSLDLKNYGIPLEELKSTHPNPPENSDLARRTDVLAVSTDPRVTRLNDVHQHFNIGQSHQRPLSERGNSSALKNSFARHLVETQNSRRYGNQLYEPIVNQQMSYTIEQREDGSYCSALLDPRRNPQLRVEHPSFIPELLHSTSRRNCPVIIPTSPVLSRRSQSNGLLKSSSSDRRHFNGSSKAKTVYPSPSTGNRC